MEQIQEQIRVVDFSKEKTIKIPDNFKCTYKSVLENLSGDYEIYVGKDCEINILQEAKGDLDINLTITVDKNSKVNREFVCVEGKQVKLKSNILLGEGSYLKNTEVFFGINDETFELNTNVIHKGIGSSADILLKGILKDRAKCKANGILKIEKEAQKVDTKLSEHVLLLSKDARAQAIPALEVEADNVKAGHAASVSQIDGDQLFYVTSRGLSKTQAEKIIAKGFLNSALDRLENEDMKKLFDTVFEMKWNSLLNVKKDFPILNRKINGKDLVYLDSAATSQKPKQVIDSLNDYYNNYNSNVHRGLHTLSEEATNKYEGSRKKIANFINAEWKETIFTKNATEAINLVANSFGRANVSEGDTILLSEMEHHSNLVPWQLLAKEKKANLKYIPITKDGTLDTDKAIELIKEKPKILAITHVSNVLGTINSIKELIKLAHENNVTTIVDACQSVPHMKVDVKDLDCDFLAFSGHKMLGPTGVGILYGKRELLEKMEPFFGGGDMIKEVSLQESTWNDLPWKFEAGTPNIADSIVLGEAVDYINKIGINNIGEHEKILVKYALDKLRQFDGLQIYGPENRAGLISFNLFDKKGNLIHPHDVNTILNEEGVAIRSGHMCCMPLMHKLEVPAVTRASFHIYNDFEDVDKLVEALEKTKKIFNRGLE